MMFIDSPDFSRRKVLNAKNAIDASSRPEQYEFGLQRSLLAKHVAQHLNSHDNNQQILERFRREAEQLKRQKWLNKRAKSIPPQPKPQPKSQSQGYIKLHQENVHPKILPTDSVIIMDDPEKEREQAKLDLNIRDGKTSKLQKLLHQKQKQLRKKDRKLERSQQLIKKMQEKIRRLQRERQFVDQKEQLQNQKINALIEQMNYRIASNRVLFQEELAKLKAYQLVSERPRSLATENNQNFNYPLPNYSQAFNKKIGNQPNPNKLVTNPSVIYELPKDASAHQNVSKLSKLSKNKFQKNSLNDI